jgi:hypothetical protein
MFAFTGTLLSLLIFGIGTNVKDYKGVYQEINKIVTLSNKVGSVLFFANSSFGGKKSRLKQFTQTVYTKSQSTHKHV